METKFALQSNEFSLTYPRCSITPEDMLDFYRVKFHDKYTYLSVVQERHEDGTPHLHSHLQFNSRFKCSARTFDYTEHHPNVQKTKSSEDWKRYLEKAGTPLVLGFYQILSKKKKEKLTNYEILNGDLEEMINTERISALSLAGILNARKLFSEIQRQVKADLPLLLPPFWVDLELPVNSYLEKKRHYWLWSDQPNKGKTTFLSSLFTQFKSSYYACNEKFQSINSDSQLLLFDEYGKGNSVTALVLNQICDGTYKFPAKGRPAIEIGKMHVIICSNYPINSVYLQPDIISRIEARFIEICLDNYNFI